MIVNKDFEFVRMVQSAVMWLRQRPIANAVFKVEFNLSIKKQKRSRIGFTYLAALLIFVAFAYRLCNLGTQSLWHDEAWSIFSAYHPLAWGAQGTDPNAPAAFYLSLGAWMQLAGDGVFALRFWSLLFGVLTVAVAGFIARRWFGYGAALLALLFCAVNPILWTFSQEIRAYVVMPLAALLLLYLLEQVVAKGSRRAWLWLAIVELYALYSQNLAVPLVAWLNVAAVVALAMKRPLASSFQPPAKYRLRRVGRWVALQAILGAAYLPWLLTQRPTGTALNNPPPLDINTGLQILQAHFIGVRTMINADARITTLILIFFGAAVILLPFLFWRSKFDRRPLLLLSQVLLVPIFETAIIYAAHIDFHPRYYIVSVPAALMLIAAACVSLPRVWFRLERVVALSAAVSAVFIMTNISATTFSTPIYQHDDFRAIAQRYAALGPDDAIIIPYGWEPTLAYYSQKMNFKARFIGVPLYSSGDVIAATLKRELQGVKRAEVLTWYQLPADVRGAYSCLLGAMGTQVDDLTVQGLRTIGYTDLDNYSRADLTLTNGDVPIGPLKVLPPGRDDVTWGVQQVCVMTRWKAVEQPPADFDLATNVMIDTLANYWRSTNSKMLDDRQLPTTLWNVGTPQTAFLPFYVREGAVRMRYPLWLLPYSAEANITYNQDPLLAARGPQLMVIGPDNPVATSPPPPTQEFLDLPIRDGALYVHQVYMGLNQPVQQGRVNSYEIEWWAYPPYTVFTLPLTLIVQGEGWQQTQTIAITAPKVNTWFYVRIPPDATGTIQLKVRDLRNEIVIGQTQIIPYERNFTAPINPALQPVINADFPKLANFTAVEIEQNTLIRGEQFKVQLVWNPTAVAEQDFTVFVHLLDSRGQVIAQSDSRPVSGQRATLTWLPGEYITDEHTLGWSRSDYTGPAQIEVGLYDSVTGERAKLSNGEDHVLLPMPITVK